MLLGLITLLTALCISGIAAYYSIVGLTAIFAAAVTPVILMGSVLEVGKVVTTLWLHYNWERSPWKIKSYLVSAVGILMLITSMGIFGFLSKAHLEQAVPSGDVQAQVLLFDEKIKTQRDNIESNRKALAQMDASVDQMMSRTVDETGAQKSANLRSSQKKERTRLFTEIDEAQKVITKLQEERAPIASKLRKVEAEVGPIKYIAALIYGDNTDQNMLEAAVRWVIIIIVAVFDPLAIILLLAATTSIDWSKLDRKQRKHDEVEEAKEQAAAIALAADAAATLSKTQEVEIATIISDTKTLTRAEVENEFQPLIEAEREKIIEIEKTIIEQQTIIDEYAAAVSANTTELINTEKYVVELVNDLTEVSAKLNEALADKTNRDGKVSDLNVALNQINDELTVTYASVNELLGQFNDSESRNEELADELYSVTAEYNKLLQDKIAVLESLALEQQATNELAVVLSEVEGEVDALTIALAEKTAEVERLQSDIAILTAIPPVPEVVEEPVAVVEPESVVEIEVVEPEVADDPAVIEDIPSNEELLQYAADTREEFYKTTVEVIEQIRNDFVPTVEAVVIEATPEPIPTPLVDDFAELLMKDVKTATAMAAIPLPPAPPAMPVMKRMPAKVIPDDNFPLGGNASFGTVFPPNPIKGDLFLRVDFMPSKLYKWVSTRWIEMDKSTSDTYVYDLEYIKLLVNKVASGEYDIDELSQFEQDQVAVFLQNNPT